MAKDTMPEPPIRFFSEVTARKIEWLWYPYIPFGKITIIQGDPGDGKTTLLLNIAAILSNGHNMPETSKPTSRESILYQSAEDGAEDTLKPRLVSAGADCSQIAYIEEGNDSLTLNDNRLERAIRSVGARLLVLDPLQAFLGENSEMNRVDGVRPLMRHIASVAERTGCAIVVIGHMNKASGSKGIYRGLGSIDINAVARSVLLVGRVKGNPNVRVMAQLKNSLAKEGHSIAFEIHENAAIRWIGEYDITADELLNGENMTIENHKVYGAMKNMAEMLRDGELPCRQIYAVFRDMGVGKRTVDRAKKNLAIRSVKRAEGWCWIL